MSVVMRQSRETGDGVHQLADGVLEFHSPSRGSCSLQVHLFSLQRCQFLPRFLCHAVVGAHCHVTLGK